MKILSLHDFVNESKVTDRDLEEKINEFGELSDEIDRLTKELKSIQSRFSELDQEIRPVVDEMSELGQKSLQTKKYLITIKRKGTTRETFKYKDAFNLSLTKVNSQIKAILEEALQSTKTISQVKTSIGVQKIEESNIFSRIFGKLRRLFSNLVRKITSTKRDLDDLQDLAQKMTR